MSVNLESKAPSTYHHGVRVGVHSPDFLLCSSHLHPLMASLLPRDSAALGKCKASEDFVGDMLRSESAEELSGNQFPG
jgi:hypothetical protein